MFENLVNLLINLSESLGFATPGTGCYRLGELNVDFINILRTPFLVKKDI
jgi:hypothetical protein